MTDYHIPILVREVLDGMRIEKGKRFIDATLGGGGHTTEIVKLGGRVLGIDADSDAIAYAQERLRRELPHAREGEDWILVKGNFRDIVHIAESQNYMNVSGILMDLGVSSHQLDTAEKGFSYRFEDAQLDMRFDQAVGSTASDYINSATSEELYEIFTKYGEEERAGAIVHALIRARSIKQIETVRDVLEAVKAAVGDNRETSGVLSRIFQSLRIQTNDEMRTLTEGLKGAHQLLETGGRLAVISFHSLEDRIVKLYMQGSGWKVINKKPLIADLGERDQNRRSRSAKLRIAEKI